jgi:hypothetical protein
MDTTSPPTPLELTSLKGIGPVRQTRLQQALGITSLDELIQFDTDTLYDRLMAVGMSVSQREIHQWLQQAHTLVEAVDQEPVAASPTTAPAPTANFSEINLRLSRVRTAEGIEALCLEQESGDSQFISPPGDATALYDWLWRQTTPAAIAEQETGATNSRSPQLPQPKSAPTTTDTMLRVDITAMDITPLQGPNSRPLDILPPTSTAGLTKENSFTVTAHFRVISPDAASAELENLVAVAQFYGRNRLTGNLLPLGVAQSRVQHPGLSQTLESPPIHLTEPGLYQLQTVISLQDIRAASGYRELQFLRVY